MNLGIKLFRILNGIGIFLTGLFTLIFLNLLLQTGDMAVLFIVFFFGGVLIHAILANALQKSLANPAHPLKENTPGGVQVLGFFPILVGLLSVLMASMLNNPEIRDVLSKQLNEQAAAQKQVLPAGTIEAAFSFCQVVMTLYGIILVGNAILSMVYVKQWRDRQNGDQQDDTDDIGA
ncbi:hypothetical protein SAMN05428949_4850 [Chitinophaga sp. YR627]|uniref:hypothetical protein n=1 Tax=Chitinophaga sp. YR627 TaxID=1881041 RepID=UPI0008E6B46A|nr:hypothetical protein [Chitinophaga sp. YR627]SFO30000.1 hypothetical protein SAMN05428949_4850 [Chitinophaga sp. YR627]